MEALEHLIERRICEAQQRGEFDDLPGAGAPLELDDDSLVPGGCASRIAYSGTPVTCRRKWKRCAT